MTARDPGLSITQMWDQSVIGFADIKRSKKKRGHDGSNELERMVDEENRKFGRRVIQLQRRWIMSAIS